MINVLAKVNKMVNVQVRPDQLAKLRVRIDPIAEVRAHPAAKVRVGHLDLKEGHQEAMVKAANQMLVSANWEIEVNSKVKINEDFGIV